MNICDICGKKGTRTLYVNRSYDKGDDLLIVEDVPIISCPHCNENYMTAETLHYIERIKSHKKSFAKQRLVSVAAFA
jgi:YgiT-type zinc finger domain-containing protein